jgi:dihydrofolate synthase/folylpolyglutamate synthase
MAEAAGIDYLRRFPDFEQGNVSAAEALELTRVLALLEEVGSPHLRLPVVHVAGTKGKGSTSAAIASIAMAAGYRTALFTQPHLVRVNERFAVDGSLLDDGTFSTIMLDRIRPAVERLAQRGVIGIQQFEAQVALAMLWFEAMHVDVAVLEVGLGGRLDATNVVPQPLVTVLTSIGFDHTAILGSTLPLIAAEKAAIVKSGVPAVASPQRPDVVAVFEERCRTMSAPLLLGGRDWRVNAARTDSTGTHFDLDISAGESLATPEGSPGRLKALLTGPAQALHSLQTPLRGVYQGWNAGTAAIAALAISAQLPRIDAAAIRRGLASISWPGRLQTIAVDPTIVVDGAHTPESAAALADAMAALYPGRRIVLVCGAQADKDIAGIAEPLARLVTNVVATAAHHRRAASPDTIARAFAAAGHADVVQSAEPKSALALAKSLAGSDGVILATGSLYLVGEVFAETGADPWTPIREP